MFTPLQLGIQIAGYFLPLSQNSMSFTLRRLEIMSGSQRFLAIAIAGAMLLGGFAFGRLSETPSTNAEEGKLALNQATPAAVPAGAAAENQPFYLTDFKTGYTDGFNAVSNGQTASTINTTREGYNEGYKQGFADAYKANANEQPVRSAAPVSSVRAGQQEMVYRPAAVQPRRRSSKLKTALTIAAPAAIGAGIGAAAGGGKGAAAGALIGGGGGALYHLIKNRNQN
jgi:hypothetical protein